MAASGSTGSTLGPWPAYKEILQDVIALGWSQFVLADRTLKHPVGRSDLGLHTDDLVACLAMRAGEGAGSSRFMPAICIEFLSMS